MVASWVSTPEMLVETRGQKSCSLFRGRLRMKTTPQSDAVVRKRRLRNGMAIRAIHPLEVMRASESQTWS